MFWVDQVWARYIEVIQPDHQYDDLAGWLLLGA